MIQPLRIALPQDSLPFAAITLQPSALVLNNATGLNIADNTGVLAGNTYQTADFVLAQGMNYASLIAWCTPTAPAGATIVRIIPVSASNVTQQLDAIEMGSITAGGYQRVSCPIDGVYGFHLRFEPAGNGPININNVLELQLSHR